MSRIGIVSALAVEARCLPGRRGLFGWRNALPGEAMLGLSGPGAIGAQRMAEQLVARGATELVSWGLAGGLDPGIAPGTLIVADRVVVARGTGYATDKGWRQRFLSALPRRVAVREALLLASDNLVTTSAAKTVLRHRYAAVAVDMESGAIACVANRHRLPLLVLRVVVDPADMALPPALAELVARDGGVHLSRLTRLLIRRPSILWPLFELAWNVRIATSTLRRIAPMVTDHGVWPSAAAEGNLSLPP
ncbi:MAG: hypothetical protein J5I81_01010 [Nitrococcus mobilis]|nr:hypothetical protein [Nitrococcus mobilis]